MSAALDRGLLELRFGVGPDGRTRLRERIQRFPLHMTTPLYLDAAVPGMAFVYLQNPSGGVFSGDRLRIRIVADANTRLHVTTPSATKIYPDPDGAGSGQQVELVVEAGAYLEYVPEPLIPYAGARYDGQLAAEVADDATLVATEVVAPGRVAHGERFRYARVSLLTAVHDLRGDERCRDQLVLEPGSRAPGCRGLLGPYSYCATALVVSPGPRARALAETLDTRMAGLPHGLAAAGRLPRDSGAYARALTESSSGARRAVEEAWAVARRSLLGTDLPRIRR